ncbi:hypothetical protein CSUI_008391 [Cystoisospora suis]|uniref:Uncharacterized protein n=1 Tax=Cystoisospora suis TaxID=483139 RepID=A0A2C6KJQ3_9APIC|nr:hypothetical protein CSUI_008391 [Cystoisospora suis]
MRLRFNVLQRASRSPRLTTAIDSQLSHEDGLGPR